MSLINLKNVVTLGVLEDGVYPSVRDATGNNIDSSLDIGTTQILYLYHRRNGHLYLYRSSEEIEIDLTNVTAYDNTILYQLTSEEELKDVSIDEFQSVNLDSNSCNFSVAWNRPDDGYIFILVPLVLSISSIVVQGVISTNKFMLVDTYNHQGKPYAVYRNKVWLKGDLSFDNNPNVNIQIFVRELLAEELNPINQLVLQLTEHIDNNYNPHHVTKEQIGLGNIDNTRDLDKPVSTAQKEAIDNAIQHADDLKQESDDAVTILTNDINNKLDALNRLLADKVSVVRYNEDITLLQKHVTNTKNPHNVDKTQVGLAKVDNTADIDKPVSTLQKQYVDATKGTIRTWFAQLNTWITNHVNSTNELFANVWKAINTKLSKEEYANDRCNIRKHIDNFNNPHQVTAEQLGLGTAAEDILQLQHDVVIINDNVSSKQDSISDQLTTTDKTVIGAINELNGEIDRTNNHLVSDSIKRIEITSKIPETSFDSILWVRIPKNNEDYINVDITATPETSTIIAINSEGNRVEGVGTVSIKALINTRLHIITSNGNDYHVKEDYVQLEYDDVDLKIDLAKKDLITLNISATPENANIEVFAAKPGSTNFKLIASGTGSVSYETYDKLSLKVNISADAYISQEHNLSLTTSLSKAYNLVLSPIPQGYVNLSAIDLTTSANIEAYVHEKNSDVVLGQILTNRPLRISGELNTTKELVIASKDYIDQELTVTFTDPATDTIVDLEPEPPIVYNKPFQVFDNTGNKADYSHIDFKVFNSASGNWETITSSDNTYFYIEGEEDEEFNIKIESDIYLPVYLVVQLNSEDVYTINIEQVPPIPDDLVMFKVTFYVSPPSRDGMGSYMKYNPYDTLDVNYFNSLSIDEARTYGGSGCAVVAPKWVKTSVTASDYTKRVHTIKDNVLSVYAHDGESLLIEVEFEGYQKITETVIASATNIEFKLNRYLKDIIWEEDPLSVKKNNDDIMVYGSSHFFYVTPLKENTELGSQYTAALKYNTVPCGELGSTFMDNRFHTIPYIPGYWIGINMGWDNMNSMDKYYVKMNDRDHVNVLYQGNPIKLQGVLCKCSNYIDDTHPNCFKNIDCSFTGEGNFGECKNCISYYGSNIGKDCISIHHNSMDCYNHGGCVADACDGDTIKITVRFGGIGYMRISAPEYIDNYNEAFDENGKYNFSNTISDNNGELLAGPFIIH